MFNTINLWLWVFLLSGGPLLLLGLVVLFVGRRP